MRGLETSRDRIAFSERASEFRSTIRGVVVDASNLRASSGGVTGHARTVLDGNGEHEALASFRLTP